LLVLSASVYKSSSRSITFRFLSLTTMQTNGPLLLLTKQGGLHSNPRFFFSCQSVDINEREKDFSLINSSKTWLSKRFWYVCLSINLSTRFLSYSSAHSLLFDTPRIVSRVTLLTLARLARDFTIFRKVGSLFPSLPMPHIFPASPIPFAVPFDYRHETHRLSPEMLARVFLFPFLCERMWHSSLNGVSRK